jgi:hypothetical protein
MNGQEFIVVMNHRLRTNDPLSTEKGSTLDAHMAGRRIPLAIGDPRRRDGAFMEPSGRNPWQPVPNGTPPKTAQTSRSATGGNPRQPFRSDGKEGVNGSSPLEGFAKAPTSALGESASLNGSPSKVEPRGHSSIAPPICRRWWRNVYEESLARRGQVLIKRCRRCAAARRAAAVRATPLVLRRLRHLRRSDARDD